MRWSDKPAINHGKLFYCPQNELPIIGSDTFTWTSLPSILNPERCNSLEGPLLPSFFFRDFFWWRMLFFLPPSNCFLFSALWILVYHLWDDHSPGVWWWNVTPGLWLAVTAQCLPLIGSLLWPRSDIHLAPPGPRSHGSEASLLSRCHDVTMTHEAWPHPVCSASGW